MLLSVLLDLHTAGDPAEGLSSGEVGHVNDGVIRGSVDVADGEEVVALSDGRAGLHLNLGHLGSVVFLGFLGLNASGEDGMSYHRI